MRGLLVYMARPEGVEPPTNRIGICYSIQLSYGRMIFDGQASYLLMV